MPAHIHGNEFAEHPAAARPLSHADEEKQREMIGNERLTALISLVLVVLIIVELVTSAFLRPCLGYV